MKNEFTTKEVGKILGAKPQLVEDWISRGLIAPDLQKGEGPGSKRLFSLEELRRAALAYQLKKTFKMDRGSILHVLRACQGKNLDWMRETIAVFADIDGQEGQPFAFPFSAGNEPHPNFYESDFYTVINLSSIAQWVEEKIKKVL